MTNPYIEPSLSAQGLGCGVRACALGFRIWATNMKLGVDAVRACNGALLCHLDSMSLGHAYRAEGRVLEPPGVTILDGADYS